MGVIVDVALLYHDWSTGQERILVSPTRNAKEVLLIANYSIPLFVAKQLWQHCHLQYPKTRASNALDEMVLNLSRPILHKTKAHSG